MRQCPDCEEKDRVVIAGKVFCANCGTPWQPTDVNEEKPYLTKVGVLKPDPAPAAEVYPGAPPVVPMPVPTQVAAMPIQPPAPTPPVPMPPLAEKINDPIKPPIMPITTVPAVATPPAAPMPVQAPSLPAMPLPPVTPLSPPTPVVATVPSMPAPIASSTPLAPAPIQVAPVSPTIPPIITSAPIPAPAPAPIPAPAPVLVPPITEMKERIGSEIPSLESRDESVLTDTDLKALSAVQPLMPPPAPVASAPEQPAATIPVQTPAPAPLAPVVPIVPVAQNPSTPAAIAAAPPTLAKTVGMAEASLPPTPASTPNTGNGSVDGIVAPITYPAAITAPLPGPAPAAVPDTTVAGVTMSREAALQLALGADANLTKPAKSGPAKPVALVMGVIAMIMLGAYLWQANYPAMALKLAGMRSGVNVAIPAYLPTGWSLSRQVSASDGTISYKVAKGGQSFNVTEQQTQWDSQALLEQYVLPKTSDYLALQAEGLTIYVYGDNQAAWVSNGMVHKLEGQHGLSQDEIIRIATSL